MKKLLIILIVIVYSCKKENIDSNEIENYNIFYGKWKSCNTKNYIILTKDNLFFYYNGLNEKISEANFKAFKSNEFYLYYINGKRYAGGSYYEFIDNKLIFTDISNSNSKTCYTR